MKCTHVFRRVLSKSIGRIGTGQKRRHRSTIDNRNRTVQLNRWNRPTRQGGKPFPTVYKSRMRSMLGNWAQWASSQGQSWDNSKPAQVRQDRKDSSARNSPTAIGRSGRGAEVDLRRPCHFRRADRTRPKEAVPAVAAEGEETRITTDPVSEGACATAAGFELGRDGWRPLIRFAAMICRRARVNDARP